VLRRTGKDRESVETIQGPRGQVAMKYIIYVSQPHELR